MIERQYEMAKPNAENTYQLLDASIWGEDEIQSFREGCVNNTTLSKIRSIETKRTVQRLLFILAIVVFTELLTQSPIFVPVFVGTMLSVSAITPRLQTWNDFSNNRISYSDGTIVVSSRQSLTVNNHKLKLDKEYISITPHSRMYRIYYLTNTKIVLWYDEID